MKGDCRMQKKFTVFFSLLIIGLASSCVKKEKTIITQFYNYPNPFNLSADGKTTFKLVFDNSSIKEYKLTLEIFTESGNPAYVVSQTISGSPVSSPLNLDWNGLDNRGNQVKNGIYRSIVTLEIIKDLTDSAAGTYKEFCYTVVN